MSITLPPLPPSYCQAPTTHADSFGTHLVPMYTFSAAQLRARDIEVAKCVLEAAARVCDETAVDATSEERMKFLTAQGKASYEGMWAGAINCACGIRALEVSHD